MKYTDKFDPISIKNERNIKREKKLFFSKIEKKSSNPFKYVWNNHISLYGKEYFYNNYYKSYNNFYLKDLYKSSNITKIIDILIYYYIISEKEGIIIKRKYIIDNLINK